MSKWVAANHFNGKQYFLGYYSDIEETSAAQKKAENNYIIPMIKIIKMICWKKTER